MSETAAQPPDIDGDLKRDEGGSQANLQQQGRESLVNENEGSKIVNADRSAHQAASKGVEEGERKVTKSNGVSWAGVVQSNPKMKRYDYEERDVDGVPTIRIPNEVFENSKPLWEDILVGKFQSTAPVVGKIFVLVNKIWTLGDRTVKIDVITVDKTTVKFRISNVAVRNRVLRRGMWNICGIPMIISKWNPVAEEVQPEVETMPLWVVVKNVPRTMYAWKCFAFLTSPIGEPIRLHPDTEMCKNFDEGKVFVEADLTKPFLKERNFDMESSEKVMVTFEYPWLPPRCHECSKWGHNVEDCLKKKNAAVQTPPHLII